jgi:uncharacterized protein YqeY
MKSADTLRRDTLRFVLSAVHNEEVNKRTEADDAMVIDVLGKQAKMRRDSIDAFRGGNRLELADKEERELAIIQDYLPTQLHDEAVRELAERAIAATGASGKKDLGKVMAALRAETKDRADGKTVARIVNELLS